MSIPTLSLHDALLIFPVFGQTLPPARRHSLLPPDRLLLLHGSPQSTCHTFRSSDCADRSCQPSRLNQRRSPPCGGSRYRSTTIRVPARVRGAAAGGRVPAGRARMRLVWITPPQTRIRSEENTSELQSLMRISYAVFCL